MHQTALTSEAVALAKPRWAVERTVVPVPEPAPDLSVSRWLKITVIALGAAAVALAFLWAAGGVLGV